MKHQKRTRHCEEGAARRGNLLKLYAILLALLLLLECTYCVSVFTDWVPPLTRLRNMYIETALSTLNHRWLATALIPGDVVQEVYESIRNAREDQLGVQSGIWDLPASQSVSGDGEDGFFAHFPELDREQTLSWLEKHPEIQSQGWEELYVNQSGLNAPGLDLYTACGDQVLAIDAKNGILVIRIRRDLYRGVLILGKDPARLACASAQNWGAEGQKAGEIAENHNALVALTGSGFNDGALEGTDQTGAAMCGGKIYGEHLKPGYKRLELRADDRLYVVDAPAEFHPDCTDATEWYPALIVDGVNLVRGGEGYAARNPRCCLGQRSDGTVLMLCIEGRYLDSLGATIPECAEVLERYGACQAMNLDGGTSAICWYDGEYITRCSDPDRPEGRPLPNAWIYGK